MAAVRRTFGEYLSKWMADRRLTAMALARLTGEKSATSIARLKADECTPSRCWAFLEQLKDAFPDLTEEDIRAFRMGIIVLSLGKEQFDAYVALNRIFLKNKAMELEKTQLSDMLLQYAEADVCHVICMQCTDCFVADALSLMCKHALGSLQIDHYVSFPMLTSAAEFLAHALPAMCDSRYAMVELRYDDEKPRLGLTAQSFLYVQAIRGEDEEYALLIPCHDGTVLQLPCSRRAGFEACARMIKELPCRHIPVNTTYRYDRPKDLIQFFAAMNEHFKSNATYIYSRDFHFAVIPVDILHSAFSRNATPPPALANTVTELRSICYQSFVHLRESKRPIRLMMSRSGIRHFMATGLLSDHFFALHVFTPEERIKVLENIIRIVRTNPNITIHFLRSEAGMQLYDFTLAANTRLTITGAHAPRTGSPFHAIAETYMDIRVEDHTMVAQVTRYFEEYLLAEHTCTNEESIAFLSEQIALARQAL